MTAHTAVAGRRSAARSSAARLAARDARASGSASTRPTRTASAWSPPSWRPTSSSTRTRRRAAAARAHRRGTPEVEMLALDRGPGHGATSRSAARRLFDRRDAGHRPRRDPAAVGRLRHLLAGRARAPWCCARLRPRAARAARRRPFEVGGVVGRQCRARSVCGDAWARATTAATASIGADRRRARARR